MSCSSLFLFLGNVPQNATVSVIQNIYAKIEECYIYKAKKDANL